MRSFTLNELEELISILFVRTKDRDDQKSSIEAATRCFYEYESIMNENETIKLVCSIIIGRLLMNHGNRIFIGQYNLVLKASKEIIEKQNQLDLKNEERDEIVGWANDLIEKLPKMQIEHNPQLK